MVVPATLVQALLQLRASIFRSHIVTVRQDEAWIGRGARGGGLAPGGAEDGAAVALFAGMLPEPKGKSLLRDPSWSLCAGAGSGRIASADDLCRGRRHGNRSVLRREGFAKVGSSLRWSRLPSCR
jgi:hypothetical protein